MGYAGGKKFGWDGPEDGEFCTPEVGTLEPYVLVAALEGGDVKVGVAVSLEEKDWRWPALLVRFTYQVLVMTIGETSNTSPVGVWR